MRLQTMIYKRDDLKQVHSIAKSKVSFAKSVLNEDDFSKGFDMTAFHKIFDIIKVILEDINSSNSSNN